MVMGWRPTWSYLGAFPRKKTKTQRRIQTSTTSPETSNVPKNELPTRTRRHSQRDRYDEMDPAARVPELLSEIYEELSDYPIDEEEVRHYKVRRALEGAMHSMGIQQREILHLEQVIAGLRKEYNELGGQIQLEHQNWERERLDWANRMSTLEQDFSNMSSQLESSKKHNLFLSGARRASLVPDTVKDDFVELDYDITDWVQRRVMDPVVDNEQRQGMALQLSLQDPNSTNVLLTLLKDESDLRRTSELPRTDENIITTLVWRFLGTNIFDEEMLGLEEATSRIKAVRELERLMTASSVSNDGLYIISVWRSQVIYAIVHDPQLRHGRQIRIGDLVDLLAKTLKLFMIPQSPELQADFVRTLRENVIEPAVKLHEQLICERDIYRLTLDKYLPRDGNPDGAASNASFYRDLPDLECLIVKAKKQIPLKKVIDSGVRMEELRNGLSALCALRPALTKRQISDKDGIGDPEILTKQKMLVLWDPDFSGTEDRTFFYELAHPRMYGRP